MMYDLAVIGGGPAGYSAALEGISHGLTVVLFEKDLLGGTCLNRGCVPTKHLTYTADFYTRIRESDVYGISGGEITVDFETVMKRKQDIVLQLRNSLEQMMLQKKIEIIYGNAEIIQKGKIACSGQVYEVANILIATGSVPSEPLVTGAVTSNEILELDYIPETMTILGGGVVAVECAHIFSSMGTKVTMCIRGERLLRGWDRELALGAMQNLKKHGVTIMTKCSLQQMEKQKADVVLSAAGRIPCVDGIFSESMGIRTDNGIVVDETGWTGVHGIYAAGDVVSGSCQLAHIGMEQGRRVVRHIVGKNLTETAIEVRCIYIHPEIATVGMDEAEAKNKGINIISGKQTMYSNVRTMVSGGERGFIKLIAKAETLELIGAQLMCERAGDIVSELALAINSKLTVNDLLVSVRPHPSFCEAVTEAAAVILEKCQ